MIKCLTLKCLFKGLKDNRKGLLKKRPFSFVAGKGQLSNQLLADLLAFSELPQ